MNSVLFYQARFKSDIHYSSVCCLLFLTLTSLVKEGMFLVVLVCLSVCKQHYSNGYEQIVMKFCGGARDGTMKD